MVQLSECGATAPSQIATLGRPIVLVCAADNHYAMGLAVTVLSAVKNLSPSHSILLFVIDGGISPTNRQRLERTLRSHPVTIEWLRPNPALVDDLLLSGHLTSAAYYRLLIPDLLPPHLHRAIYLDCDLIVQGDLAQLWQFEMGGKALLAAVDIGVPSVSSERGLLNYRELGIPADARYFNSGVLCLDLVKWRNQNISASLIDYIRQHRQQIRWHDQDGLNAVLAGDWGELDPRWNRSSTIFRYSWQDTPYSEAVYQQLLKDAYIIHFLESGKPWTPGFRHPEKSLFFQYLDQTAWPVWLFRLQLTWKRIQARLQASRVKLT
ncbi:hypothetical protein BST81_21455 [Leptolyngbya sp. 'hensonii']|uniref:glycosyltransferase family 8 protein n=1 Tax=Leptolyngbya sp. 'hensonii' TaxID=1922337 RepID=UPI00094F4C6D|nr:glycosyltransferase family 8 protein [Leptolyngbya sp. 'hensonii']OLP16360.1 hypothetical protein BST81_21455 [Leptolyngbya sp. 'hensonii']